MTESDAARAIAHHVQNPTHPRNQMVTELCEKHGPSDTMYMASRASAVSAPCKQNAVTAGIGVKLPTRKTSALTADVSVIDGPASGDRSRRSQHSRTALISETDRSRNHAAPASVIAAKRSMRRLTRQAQPHHLDRIRAGSAVRLEVMRQDKHIVHSQSQRCHQQRRRSQCGSSIPQIHFLN
jgi:hypothetical protein